MLRLASCVCLQNYFLLISQTRSRIKGQVVILAATAQKKERHYHSCSILKACYLVLYLALNKVWADLEQKNSLKASQKGIHFVSWASKVNLFHFFLFVIIFWTMMPCDEFWNLIFNGFRYFENNNIFVKS